MDRSEEEIKAVREKFTSLAKRLGFKRFVLVAEDDEETISVVRSSPQRFGNLAMSAGQALGSAFDKHHKIKLDDYWDESHATDIEDKEEMPF